MNQYGKLLLLETPKACDCVDDLSFLRERHLHALWAEQKWLKPMQTASGLMIEVISPGIWNNGPGPDFLKAELKIQGVTLRGDIEIHIKDESWDHHGHNNDSRYNNVVLHISMTAGGTAKQITKENGERPAQAYFENYLTQPIDQLIHIIELDHYPYKEFLGAGACSQTLFHELDEKAIQALFHEAALWRALKKYDYLNFAIDDAAEILIAGICQGLGFRHNSAAFLQLYRSVQRLEISDEGKMLATLMQMTGFFSEKYEKLWGEDAYYRQLKELSPVQVSQISLNFQQIRPLNHPLRRLVYLSKFLTDPGRFSIQTKLMGLWEAWESIEPADRFLRQMTALIPHYSEAYFETRYFFGEHRPTKKLGLIGDETKLEILLNVFIPFLQNTMKRSSDQLKISALLRAFPHRETGKFKYLSHRFFGQTDKKEWIARGDLQQGAYQLHKDFCQHYESSCQGCPFVKKYKNNFNLS